MAKQITKPQKQLSFVVDLNKCIGCQTCTVACKKLWTDQKGEEPIYWRNVETRPGKGYPRNWENEGGGFNAAGDRNFTIFLDEGTAKAMENDGWNIKWLPPREEGDDMRPQSGDLSGFPTGSGA